MLEKHFARTLYLHKLLVISPQSLVRIIQRSMHQQSTCDPITLQFFFFSETFVSSHFNYLSFLFQCPTFGCTRSARSSSALAARVPSSDDERIDPANQSTILSDTRGQSHTL
jgi:hypothetical protein